MTTTTMMSMNKGISRSKESGRRFKGTEIKWEDGERERDGLVHLLNIFGYLMPNAGS